MNRFCIGLVGAIFCLVPQTGFGGLVLYGGLGGRAISSGPLASQNDGALVTIDQTAGTTALVGHPSGVARLTGIAFDPSGNLFGSTLGAIPFPPPPAVTS